MVDFGKVASYAHDDLGAQGKSFPAAPRTAASPVGYDIGLRVVALRLLILPV